MKVCIPFSVFGLIFLGFYPSFSYGLTYGNPTRTLEPGAYYVGLAASEFNRKFDGTLNFSTASFGSASVTFDEKIDISEQVIVVGFGASEEAVIEILFGSLTFELDEDEIDGNVFGGIFLMKGFLISFRQGDIENSNWVGDFSQIDIGYGISDKAGENSSLYGILLFSKSSANINATPSNLSEASTAVGFTITSADLEFEEDTAIGVAGGFEYLPDENIAVSFEIHALFETGFGLRFAARF